MIQLILDQGMFATDLSPFQKYAISSETANWLVCKGANYYKLLAYLSKQLPKGSKVADLGTMVGNSAISLASNPDVEVLTFDIQDNVGNSGYKNLKNVKFYPGDCIHYVDHYIDCPLIFLDIDPHDGIQEKRLYDILVERKFRGLLICDDIYFDPMKPFWDAVTLDKEDVSCPYGHGTGTGIVIFDPTFVNITIA